jgi:hypothetical protein
MSFRGLEVKRPLARLGLVGTQNLSQIPPDAYIDVMNVDFSRGTLGREGGSTHYNATAFTGAPKVWGLFDYWPTSALQRLIAYTSAGEIKRDTSTDGSAVTNAATGLSATGVPVFCLGGRELLGNARKLFLTTGVNVVQVLDGDTATSRNINATKPADWTGATQPRFLVLHNLRLWGGLGNRLYGSTTTDHEDFTAVGAVNVGMGASDEQVEAAASFKGQLFVFKWPLGILVLDDASLNIANWQVRKLTSSVGIAGPSALCLTDDDVLFMSETGRLHLLSNVRDGDVQASDLTEAADLAPYIRDTLDTSRDALQRVQAVYYPEKDEAHFACRRTGSTVNDLTLIVDLARRVPRVKVSDQNTRESVALRLNATKRVKLIAGDDTGRVWHLDQEARASQGAAYETKIQTPHWDFQEVNDTLGQTRKTWKGLQVVMKPKGSFTLFVDTVLDGQYGETLAFTTGVGGSVLGSFILGVDVLAGAFVQRVRRRMRGSSYTLSLVLRQSGAYEDFEVQELAVAMKPSGRRPQ